MRKQLEAKRDQLLKSGAGQVEISLINHQIYMAISNESVDPWSMEEKRKTLTLTHAQWMVAMEALGQYVENSECADDFDSESEPESLVHARYVLEMLQTPVVGAA